MIEISGLKNLIKQSNKEIIDVTTAINRSNSKIENNTIKTFGVYPFEDKEFPNGMNIELKEETKKDILGKFPNGMSDGKSLLLSLLSIYNRNKNQRNHIVSIEIENNEIINYYVNTLFLEEELNMTKLFVDEINLSTKLNESLNLLIEMFINRTDSYYQKKRYANDDYSSYAIFNKVSLIKDTLKTIYGSMQNLDIDDSYYLFVIDDISINQNVEKYVKSNKTINLNLYNFYRNKIEDKQNKIGSSVINFNDNLESLSQSFAINSLNKRITNIIGAAGSGKTYLAYVIMTKYVELSALNKENYPFLYTTYSKYSLEQFLKYSKEYKDLLFINDIEHLKNKAEQLNEPFDIQRFKDIESKINKLDLSYVNQRFENINSSKNDLNKIYQKSLDTDSLIYVRKYCDYLKNQYVKPGFIDSLLFKFNFKQPGQHTIPNTIIKPLELGGVQVPKSICELDLLEESENIRNKYFVNQQKVQNYFKTKNFDESYEAPFVYDKEINITNEELIYFLTYRCLVKNPELKHKYINAIHSCIDKKYVDVKLLKDVFPIWTGLVTNIVDYDINFKQLIVDESVLVPGYFYSLIMNKSENVITMGDVNQLSLNQSFYPNIQHIVNKIYGEKGYLSLSCKANFEQQSFFDHITDAISKDSTLVLTDNFRCNSKIFELSRFIGGDSYNDYFQKYINKNQLSISTEDLTHHYNKDEEKKFILNDKVIDTPFLFIDNKDDKYDKLKSFIKENNLAYEDVMVIVPFSYNISKVRTILGDGIMVDTIENVQGIEKKVVVFDWNFLNTNDDSFKYIDKRKFNLMITRAKNIFITIANKDYCFTTDIDQTRTDNGFIILNKFMRNSSKFEIIEI